MSIILRRNRLSFASIQRGVFSTTVAHDESAIAKPAGKINHEEIYSTIHSVWHYRHAQYKQGALTEDEFKRSIGTLDMGQLEYLKEALDSSKQAASSTLAIPLSLSIVIKRFLVTAEVTISKIFMAGFGWQGGALVAGMMGMGAADPSMWLCAGVGDAMGVGLGHYGFYKIKSAFDKNIDMVQEAHSAVLLSTACVFSGTLWQPLVNFLHGTASLDFTPVACATFAGCAFAFFTGLRFGRAVWSPILDGVAPASYANLKSDALLGVAVGGASGAFVGTDVSFVTGMDTGAPVDSNWMRPALGVEAGMSDLQGMVTAGAATSIGFVACQSVQNITLRPGKNWVD